MALAYNVRRRGSAGDLNFRMVDVTLDASYAAGGYLLSAQQMGFGLNGTILYVLASNRGGFFFDWDFTNSRLMVRDASGVAGAASPEVANNNANINNLVVRLLAFGVGHG